MPTLKRHKFIVFILCIVIIALLVSIVLMPLKASKKHDIAIYAIEGKRVELDDELITDLEPVITTTDIIAYNPEKNMLFLSEDYLASLPQNRMGNTVFEGGSDILKVDDNHGFAIAVDGKVILTGATEQSMASSCLPDRVCIRDCTEGLRFYLPYAFLDDIELLREFQSANEELKTAFADMNLLTDDMFTVTTYNSYKSTWDTKELWQYRTDYLGDNVKVGAIINNLYFPEDVKTDGFRLQTENKPYALEINLISESSLTAYDLLDAVNIYTNNAEILFALIGNLERVDYVDSAHDERLVSFVAGLEEDDEINLVFGAEKYYQRIETEFDFYKEFEFGFAYDHKPYSRKSEEKNSANELSIAEQILNCLNAITASPSESSVPADYIKAHPAEYYQLVLLAKEHKKEVESALTEYQGEVAEKIIEQAMAEQPFIYANDERIKVNTKGNEHRALTEKDLADVTRAFSVMAYSPIDDKTVVNPLANLLTSYYQKPEDININELIRYMKSRKLKDDDESLSDTYSDSYKFSELKKLEQFPFKQEKKIDEVFVPIGEIPVKTVENLLHNYLGKALSQLSGVGSKEALYLDEPYHCFYIYTSDFGLADFIAESGEIDGDTLTLYSKHTKLVLKHKNQIKRYYIYSYTER